MSYFQAISWKCIASIHILIPSQSFRSSHSSGFGQKQLSQRHQWFLNCHILVLSATLEAIGLSFTFLYPWSLGLHLPPSFLLLGTTSLLPFCLFISCYMAPHSSTLAWKIPWMEEPSGLQSMGSLRVGHDWATSLSLVTFMHWRRKWQPTPVFLPGESQGQGSLVGCRPWGHTESDTTKVT